LKRNPTSNRRLSGNLKPETICTISIFLHLNTLLRILGGRFAMTTQQNIFERIQKCMPELSKFGVQDVGLFGSYVRNEQSPSSDIDILVDFKPTNENFDNYMAVYDLFERLFKNEKINLVTRNGLSRHIGPQILMEVLYVKRSD
jgi:uncharacterized protein